MFVYLDSEQIFFFFRLLFSVPKGGCTLSCSDQNLGPSVCVCVCLQRAEEETVEEARVQDPINQQIG